MLTANGHQRRRQWLRCSRSRSRGRGRGICSDGDVNAAVTCMCLYWSVCVMCMYGLVGCECVRDCDKGAHDGGA